MKNFLIALQFLTILPIRVTSKVREKDFGKSLAYFPLIGMLIGLLLALVSLIVNFLPSMVTAALLVVVSVVVTGGIHLDGFADTCDGFCGSSSKERILEIMRDSRVGVMGVIGVVCILLLKFVLLASIPQPLLWRTLIAVSVFARWSQVMACFASRYAREEGKAKHFIGHASKKEFFAGSIFTVALFVMLMKLDGIALLVLSFLAVSLFVVYAKKRLGGMTGDTIGATNEIAEVALLFFAVILPRVQCF